MGDIYNVGGGNELENIEISLEAGGDGGRIKGTFPFIDPRPVTGGLAWMKVGKL